MNSSLPTALPAVSHSAPQSTSTAPQRRPASRPPVAINRVLIIENDDVFLSVMRIALTRAGYTVMTAQNGVDGLSLYHQSRPDLVITDIAMPEKDGIEVTTELRRHCRDLKIIAISGGSRLDVGDTLKKALACGANAALAKPFTFEQLADSIEDVRTSRPPNMREQS